MGCHRLLQIERQIVPKTSSITDYENRRECSIHTSGKFPEPTEHAEGWVLRDLDERKDAMTDKEILILINVISISGA